MVAKETKSYVKLQAWVTQSLVKAKCQLKLNWHLKIFEMYTTLIWDLNLTEVCAT